jgi:predicted DNA-binding transcriptional regulator AlpA
MKVKLLTFRDIQNEYGLKKNTLTKMLMRNDFIQPVKIGNRNYFDRDDLEEWIINKKEKSDAI